MAKFPDFLGWIMMVGCSTQPAPTEAGSPAPTPPLTIEKMQAVAEATVKGAQPNATLEPLRVEHTRVPNFVLNNPYTRHHCWYALKGRSLLTDFPDAAYLCVTDEGKVYYPLKPTEFSQLHALEDRTAWGDEQAIAAAKWFIHLQSVVTQDAGWIPLNSGADFLKISFNMQAASLAERGRLAEKIHAPKRIPKTEKWDTVSLYTWTNIGGSLEHWTVLFTDTGVEGEPKLLGRYGGGGYD